LESLTHAFFDCSASRPAIDWLRETWRSLSGVETPCSARLLLADDPEGWDGVNAPGTLQLWTRLHVATLGAIWQARCTRDHDPRSLAHRAALMAMDSVVGAIKRDRARTSLDIRRLDGGDFPRDWWSNTDVQLSLQRFCAEWTCPPMLCDVDGAGRLQLKLSSMGPVPLPPP
jgi:hypothetical protein